MELTQIRGIGKAYAARLREAGITSVADLAWAEDLSTLAERSGIPPAKLAGFRGEAARLVERAHRSPIDVVHSVASALFDLAEESRELVLAKTVDGLRWLRQRMPASKGRAGSA